MAELVAVAGAATSFQALFKGLLDLVAAFRTAVKDVETAPGNTKELVVQVANASTILKSLEKIQASSVEDSEALLTPPVKALGEQLLLALEKVQNDEQRKKNGQVVELAKALFRQGASKQNKSSKAIQVRIRELVEDLSHAVTFVQAVTVIRALRPLPPGHQTTEHPLVSILGFLENDDHSCWESVDIRAAPSHTSAFTFPTEIQGLGAGSATRAAREGGYEVLNSTKLRFTINYDGHAYFYFVVYDKSLNHAPELFFPKKPKKHDNELQRSLARVFPDKEEYSGDPLSFKVERADRTDGTLTKDWEQWVYLILCNEPLHTASTPELKIEDLEPKLSKMVLRQQEKPEDDDTQVETMEEEEEEDKFIAVKRYIFDIK